MPLGALGGNFEVDEHRTKASGRGGQIVLSIGDKVKVEITGVDEDLRRVSAWVVEAQAQDAKGKVTTFVPSLAAPATLREGDFVKERPGRGGQRGGERSRREEKPASGRPPKAARQASGASSGRPARPGAKPVGPGSRPARPGDRPARPGDKPARTKAPKGSVRGLGKKSRS